MTYRGGLKGKERDPAARKEKDKREAVFPGEEKLAGRRRTAAGDETEKFPNGKKSRIPADEVKLQ